MALFSALTIVSCKKKPTAPVVSTASISAVTQTTATAGGNVTSDGGAEVTARGVCWNTSENPTTMNNKTSDGTGLGSFTSLLTQLTPGTTYYVKAYATNEAGTGYGNQQSFPTGEVLLATVTTNDITSPTQTSAVSGGNITSDGGGDITARGVCWSTSQNPTIADSKTTDASGTGSFTSNITGLTAGTTYYVRAYAINSAGVAYGTQKDFTTTEAVGAIIFNPALTYGTVSDIDGNTYKTIQIGPQTWMAENLRTTKYNDGTSIPLVNDNSAWSYVSTGGYCWFNNDEATYKNVYGAIYNWPTVSTGKLCPTGWHVPTYSEWITLTTNLGGEYVAGGKLKEVGTTHWNSDSGATNETGFTAIPAGNRLASGTFHNFNGNVGCWWSSFEYSTEAMLLQLNNNYNSVFIFYWNKQDGLSVRCLKD